MSNEGIADRAKQLAERTAGSTTGPEIQLADGRAAFRMGSKSVKSSIPFVIVLGSILLASLVWSFIASWNPAVSGLIGLFLLFVVIAGVRVLSISMAKTPLLDVNANTDELTVCNYRTAGASISLSDIDFFLGLRSSVVSATGPSSSATMVAYVATKDGSLRFLTSSTLMFQDVTWIDECLRMLGYVCGKRSLVVQSPARSSSDTEQSALSKYLTGGSPTGTTGNLGESISSGGHLNMQQLLAEATVIYDPMNAEAFIARRPLAIH